ncbi:MAG: HAD family hydrolase, partial [Vicinamibacterales bacterium]
MAVKAKAILWDLDGTLVDSEELHWRSWQHAMNAEGLPVAFEQFKASFGQRNQTILRTWLGPRATDAEIERVADAKEIEYRRLAAEHGLRPLAGAAEWLLRLRADGWKQAIASSAPRLNVDAMLRALDLDQFFDAIVSSEDVTAGKPDPHVFLVAAAKLGVPTTRCIVVEDAAAGIEAARRAGMRSVGVSRSGPLSADVFVRSLADLPQDAFEQLSAGTRITVPPEPVADDPFDDRSPTSHERMTGLPWDASYHHGPPPWDIGQPQPAIMRVASEGGFAGAVLDAGCGTGENA